MKFVRDAARREEFMERLRAAVESVAVIAAAIKINLQTRGTWTVPHNRERIFPMPERRVEGRAESRAKNPGDSHFLCAGNIHAWRLVDQGSTVRSDRAKQMRIKKRESQRAIAAHRNAGNPATAAFTPDAVMRFYVGNEFANEEILVVDAVQG